MRQRPPEGTCSPGSACTQGRVCHGLSSGCLASPQACGDLIHTFIDDLVVQAVQSQFKAVCDAEFFVDFAETVLYDLFGGSQLRCNTFVALAFRDASDDRRLLEREAQVRGPI